MAEPEEVALRMTVLVAGGRPVDVERASLSSTLVGSLESLDRVAVELERVVFEEEVGIFVNVATIMVVLSPLPFTTSVVELSSVSMAFCELLRVAELNE